MNPIQKAGIPTLLSGSDGLLIAPTGSGKTEAAILPLVSRCINENWEGLAILYITPLRALNRDVDRRLGDLLDPLNLKVGVRHGDTPKNERLRQSRSPPNLLVTTPETAQIMLLGSRLREHLAGLRAIVLDEVHDLAGSERGSQLLVGLERIKALGESEIQLVGLSATVGNPKRSQDGSPVALSRSLPQQKERQRSLSIGRFPAERTSFSQLIGQSLRALLRPSGDYQNH